MKHPECDKLTAVQEQYELISAFVKWLFEQEIELCTSTGYPVSTDTEQWLKAAFFGVDWEKVKAEGLVTVEDAQAGNEAAENSK